MNYLPVFQEEDIGQYGKIYKLANKGGMGGNNSLRLFKLYDDGGKERKSGTYMECAYTARKKNLQNFKIREVVETENNFNIKGTDLKESNIVTEKKEKNKTVEGWAKELGIPYEDAHKYWLRAEKKADKSLPDKKYWAEVNSIAQKMLGAKYGEFKSKKESLMRESLEIPNTNLEIVGIGHDINGNKIIKLQTPNQRSFSIQTGGGALAKTDSFIRWIKNKKDLINQIEDKPEEFNLVAKEIVDYVQKYGSKQQKQHLKVYKESLMKKPTQKPIKESRRLAIVVKSTKNLTESLLCEEDLFNEVVQSIFSDTEDKIDIQGVADMLELERVNGEPMEVEPEEVIAVLEDMDDVTVVEVDSHDEIPELLSDENLGLFDTIEMMADKHAENQYAKVDEDNFTVKQPLQLDNVQPDSDEQILLDDEYLDVYGMQPAMYEAEDKKDNWDTWHTRLVLGNVEGLYKAIKSQKPKTFAELKKLIDRYASEEQSRVDYSKVDEVSVMDELHDILNDE